MCLFLYVVSLYDGKFLSMTQTRVTLEEATSVEKICPLHWPANSIFLLNDCQSGDYPTVDTANLPQVVLGYIKK